jgi:hypothetical protein
MAIEQSFAVRAAASLRLDRLKNLDAEKVQLSAANILADCFVDVGTFAAV